VRKRNAGGRGEAPVAAVTGKQRAEAYRRSPIFWGMVISAPIVWALAFFVVARIFHAGLR
jgi:hypothetical protein